MTFFRGNSDNDESGCASSTEVQATRLEMARQIALDSLKEDHHALEIDAKLAFGPAALLGR